MNKKLLLILSILMSLSLFTMSCAKSVAAPDVPVVGITPGQELTENDLQTALRSLNPISDSGVTYNFSQGNGFLSSDTSGSVYYFNVYDTSSYHTGISQDIILSQLKSALYNYNNISFEPSQNWESTTTSERILVVTLSSPYYTIPQELKTVKIRLYLNSGYWQ